MNSPENAQMSGTVAPHPPAEVATQRVEPSHSERIARIEQDQPLRRRIVQALSISSQTTSGLARGLGVRSESVSRLVTQLRKEGLLESIEVPGDGRRRLHDLTVAGEVELSRHLAYGAKPQPVPPSRQEAVEFLRSALTAAVEMRRRSNQLEEAESRLRVVLREARRLGESALVVDAIAALSATLRQNRKADEVGEYLDELETIAIGKSMHSGSAVAMPALALRQYELGRVRVVGVEELAKRANHLISAASLFEELAEAPQSGSSGRWKERHAWTLASLANNLRARSQFGSALSQTAAALKLFEELEDDYGRSRCLFQSGFCLRLLGEFEAAEARLTEAQALAKENSFERFQADSLMQIGEVLRCQGKMDEARGALEESRDRSLRMGLGVTQAFAHSALGAVAFHSGELHEAQSELRQAEEGFLVYEHRKGLALNSRRRAAVARLLTLEQSRRADLEGVEKLIEYALHHYQVLHSPAGETACEIERGRFRLMCQGEAPETVEALLRRLEEKTPERYLLELDPWVPRVLDSFAKATEHKALIGRAKEFLIDADRSLGELARKSVRAAAAIVGRRGDGVNGETRRALGPDEMGGEARQELDAIGPAVA